MLSIQQVQTLLAQTPSLKVSSIAINLDDALNYRIAEPLVAQHNVPPAANSAMDGYALNLEDLKRNHFQLPISQRITAGCAPLPLQKNTCARIFTGAMIPEGADTVIMQENTTMTDNGILFDPNKAYIAADNIRPKGQDITLGSSLATTGTKITPALLGLLASQGFATINVQAPLKIALLSTGNEIVAPGTPLKTGQIYNSNRYSVGSLLKQWGQVELSYLDVADTFEDTCQALKSAAQTHDLVISFGGVSVGEEDHVKDAVAALGHVEHWKVKLKPGKPLMIGRLNITPSVEPNNMSSQVACSTSKSVPILGLPGNPVSAFVTFLLFAKPLLTALTGGTFTPASPIQAPIHFAVSRPKKRPEYLRVTTTDGQLTPCNNQSSGVLSSLYACDGLAFIPEETLLHHGDSVDYYPLEVLMSRA
ncbi:molybdopterin molybdotransferase MoeA [Marinagarivorans algicola]|uniref:molybdopterin molybdotransferase MoeA n=1 Tax=Marinagarivorans algicola TaxID=1513270 RepID=UPI0006B68B95|nr:molybdopterin molybdotransferase MoeA [Marinagarivorans algicola]